MHQGQRLGLCQLYLKCLEIGKINSLHLIRWTIFLKTAKVESPDGLHLGFIPKLVWCDDKIADLTSLNYSCRSHSWNECIHGLPRYVTCTQIQIQTTDTNTDNGTNTNTKKYWTHTNTATSEMNVFMAHRASLLMFSDKNTATIHPNMWIPWIQNLQISLNFSQNAKTM